jgi:hypothetical protein
LVTSCIGTIKHFAEGNRGERTTRKKTAGYPEGNERMLNMKDEEPDCSLRRTNFGIGCGPEYVWLFTV